MASSLSTGRKTAARKAPAKAIKAVGNGMHRFAVHTDDKVATAVKRALAPRSTAPTRGAAAAAVPVSTQDPDTAAYEYLQRALKSNDMPEFSDPQGDRRAHV